MVARTPPKQKKIAAPINPILLRETVKKVATSSISPRFSFLFLLLCLVPEKNYRTRKKKKIFRGFEFSVFDGCTVLAVFVKA